MAPLSSASPALSRDGGVRRNDSPQFEQIADDDRSALRLDHALSDEIPQQSRDHLARGAEVSCYLLLRHAQNSVARRMQQHELSEALAVIARVNLLELRHQPIDQAGQRLHGEILD